MVTIKQLNGLDPLLYQLVGPLVMNPDVLKRNRNYPFKTSKNFQWLIAMDKTEVVGFMPIEFRNQQAIINNYYTADENQEVLDALIKTAIDMVKDDFLLVSITQVQHRPTFLQNDFAVEHEWKNYVKMLKEG